MKLLIVMGVHISPALKWLTGGKLDIGLKLWNVKISESNPQVGKYKYDKRFWMKDLVSSEQRQRDNGDGVYY